MSKRKIEKKHEKIIPKGEPRTFHLEFLNQSQKLAWGAYQQHDILFLIGPAGTSKTFLSTAFAISDIVNKTRKKIILTRPIVEAGEKLGFLPGDLNEKVNPYMMPIWDAIDKLTTSTSLKEQVDRAVHLCPLAYMRGVNFDDAVCIFDEAQNATYKQLILFLTRLGKNSKMIITGDPDQSDLPGEVALTNLVEDLETLKGIGVIQFKESSIVRNPLVSDILKRIKKSE